MTRIRQAAAPLIVTLAVVAAAAPRPPGLVESSYSSGVYPRLQSVVTALSNLVAWSVFDVLIVIAGATLLWWWGRGVTLLVTRRQWRGPWVALRRTVVLASALYLWFVAVWGLNYARLPLDVRLGLPPEAPTAAEVAALLTTAVAESNRLASAAHASPAAQRRDDADVARALAVVDAQQGRPRPTVPGLPKRTLLAPYFRMAGVDGLTAPFALETLLNADLTPYERPFTLAHEWAHLSGHASEAEANAVAWLATQAATADPLTTYSGWLFLVSETSWQVSGDVRARALAALGAVPRADLADIARRMATRVDVVEQVGWRVYDSYLRSQGVDDGIRSYSRAVSLIVRVRRAAAPPAPVPQ